MITTEESVIAEVAVQRFRNFQQHLHGHGLIAAQFWEGSRGQPRLPPQFRLAHFTFVNNLFAVVKKT